MRLLHGKMAFVKERGAKYNISMRVLHITVSERSFDSVLDWVTRQVGADVQHHLVSVNPEGVLLAQKNDQYRDALNRASLGLADGVGIQLASKILNASIPPRVPGVDVMIKLCEIAAQKHWKVYLRGGGGETAKKTAEKLKAKFPGLAIEGEEGISREVQSSKFKENSERGESMNKINAISPQLLFVALGQPKQELWIDEHLKEMPSVRIAMGVGGAFDFISGKVPRAPLVMRRIGLEWLWRLFVQPWRAPRIFNATVRFIWSVVKERLKR